MKKIVTALLITLSFIIGGEIAQAQQYYSPVINFGSLALNTGNYNQSEFLSQRDKQEVERKYLQRMNLSYFEWLKNAHNAYSPPVAYRGDKHNNLPEMQKEIQKVANNWLKFSYIPKHSIIPDGFIDAPVYISEFRENGKPCNNNKVREYVIVDKTKDKKLDHLVNDFKYLSNNSLMSEKQKAYLLLKLVDKLLSNGHNNRLLFLSNSLSSNKAYYLGDIVNSGAGVCRHRALLAKVLGDSIGLDISLVRGYFAGNPHAWNEITFYNGETVILDIMHRKIINIAENPHQAYSYKSMKGESLYLSMK